MAKLTNSLVGGKNTRINDMFTNRSLDVGYRHTHAKDTDLTSGLRLDFLGTEEGERNYGLVLDPNDVGKVIDRLFNPNYNMGFFGANTYDPRNRSDFHFEELLGRHGINFSTYRYPAPSFANGTKRWYWVRAVNRHHAQHQFSRFFKDYDDSLLEEFTEKQLEETS